MIGKRLAVRGLEALCRVMWGFPPTIITLIVDHMGPMRAIGWFGTHMPRFLASRVVLGPVRVHLACIVVSLRNGCGYGAYGHVYALELLYLRHTGASSRSTRRRSTSGTASMPAPCATAYARCW